MGIKHATQTTEPDNPNYDVSKDEWNANHNIEAGTIVNADINTSAAIALSKLATNPNKHVVFSAVRAGTAYTYHGFHRCVQINAIGEYARGGIAVPDDFSSLIKAVIFFVATNNGTDINLTASVEFGKVGEDHDVHTANDGGVNYTFTAEKIVEVDISSLLAGLAGGDLVAWELKLNEVFNDIDVVASLIEYSV